MPTTPSGIHYTVEVAGGPQNPTGRNEKWVRGSNQSTEIVRVAWHDWAQFKLDLLGNSYWLGDPINGYTLSRNLPMPHPYYPWMIPLEINLLGVIGTMENGGDIGQFSDPTYRPGTAVAGFAGPTVVAAVTYEAVRYNFSRSDDYIYDNENPAVVIAGERLRYVEWDREGSVEALAVQGTRWFWIDNGPGIGAFNSADNHGGVQRRYKFGEITYQWHEVPSILDQYLDPGLPPQLLANWTTVEGTINQDEFDSYPAGTLLCAAIQRKKIISALGNFQWEVTIPIAHQPDGWNNKFCYIDPKTGKPAPAGDPRDGFYPVGVTQFVALPGANQAPQGFSQDAAGNYFRPYVSTDFNSLIFVAG